MTQHRTLAQTMVSRYALQTPVDVEQLIRCYADLEEDTIPVSGTDAILVDHIDSARPTVILQSSLPDTRRRFTLAHELGHILIPWHIGTIGCNGDTLSSQNKLIGAVDLEEEAHEFASELLVPTDWLRELTESIRCPAKTLKAVSNDANVSPWAACIALTQRALSPGAVYFAVGSDGILRFSGQSEGTGLSMYHTWGTAFQSHWIDELYGSHTTINLKGQTFHWVTMEVDALPIETNDESSSEVLRAIVADVVSSDQIVIWTQRIGGVVGSANGFFKSESAHELFQLLQRRFRLQRNGIESFSRHDRFNEYLWKRALEIKEKADKKRNKSKKKENPGECP